MRIRRNRRKPGRRRPSEQLVLRAARRTRTRYLLTGLHRCAACGANFIARGVRNTRLGRYHCYGCAYHARRGDAVCPNRTLLPQAAIEQDLLDLLQRVILTIASPEHLLAPVNT